MPTISGSELALFGRFNVCIIGTKDSLAGLQQGQECVLPTFQSFSGRFRDRQPNTARDALAHLTEELD